MDDCLVRNYSPLIRQAFGERVIVGLPSSFISQGILKEQLLYPTLPLCRVWGCFGHPHTESEWPHQDPRWSGLARACNRCHYVECKDSLEKPHVWHTSYPSHPKYLLKMSQPLKAHNIQIYRDASVSKFQLSKLSCFPLFATSAKSPSIY